MTLISYKDRRKAPRAYRPAKTFTLSHSPNGACLAKLVALHRGRDNLHRICARKLIPVPAPTAINKSRSISLLDSVGRDVTIVVYRIKQSDVVTINMRKLRDIV